MAGVIVVQVGKWGELGRLPAATLESINDRVHPPAVEELDRHFGGRWLEAYEASIAPDGGIISYIFQVNVASGTTAEEMTEKMQEVFDRHWAGATRAYRSQTPSAPADVTSSTIAPPPTSAVPNYTDGGDARTVQLAGVSPTTATPGRGPAATSLSHWYRATDSTKQMSQIVVSIPPGSGQESLFGTLMLSLQKYPIVLQTWSATFFRLDGKSGPFLLVRADSVASELGTRPLAIGFTFFKFNSGGLFVIFIRIRDDSLLSRLKSRFPDLQVVAIEGAMGLDDPDQVKRISDAFEKEQLHVVVAGNSPSSIESFDLSSGRSVQSSAPQPEFDIEVAIPSEMRTALREELGALLSHHASIPPARRNWNAIQQDYANAMPLSAEPVLADKAASPPRVPASPAQAPNIPPEASRGQPPAAVSKKWWVFWK